jgi:hypothetical protein
MRKIERLALHTRPLLVATVLLLLTTGFTDCDSFTDVTVPAYDFDAPITYDGVWKGTYVRSALTGNSFEYHLAPGQTVQAVSSAIDSGGLKNLEMIASYSESYCCNSSLCYFQGPHSMPADYGDQQVGGVGSTVSNGMWLYSTVQVPTCARGGSLQWFRFRWQTWAEDFHGNSTLGNSQSIVYP